MSWFVDHPTLVTFTSHYNYGFADLFGRVANLTNLRATGNIYVPFGDQAFTYPPGAILFFWPITWLPAANLSLVWSTASLFALAGVLTCVARYLFQRDLRTTFGVCAGAAALSAAVFPPVTECLTWGQTATFLLWMVVGDLLVVRGRARGVLVGVATAIKLYPGLFIIVWLLRRQWRTAGTALVSFAVVTGVAWLVWPRSATTFVTKLMIGGQDFVRLAGGTNALKSSSVAALFTRPPFHWGTLTTDEKFAVSALVVVAALVAGQRLWRRGFELSAMVVVLIASVIGAPVAWDHYFAFAPILVLIPFEVGWRSALARTSLVGAVVMMYPWFLFRQPVPHTPWTATYAFAARNALVLVALAVIIASFWPGARRGSEDLDAAPREPGFDNAVTSEVAARA